MDRQVVETMTEFDTESPGPISTRPFAIGAALFTTLQEAFDAVRPGQTIRAYGMIISDSATLRTPGVTLRGPATLAARDMRSSKALIVVKAPGFQVDSLAVTNPAAEEGERVFIHFEADGDLTLRNCHVRNCEHALFVSEELAHARILLEDCRFERVDAPFEQSSVLTVGRIAELRIRGGRYHAGIRSCAATTLLEAAYIHRQGASHAIELPLGGVVEMDCCTFVRDDVSSLYGLIAYGKEARFWPRNSFHFYASNRVAGSRIPAEAIVDLGFEPEVKLTEAPRFDGRRPGSTALRGKVAPAFDEHGRLLESWWDSLPFDEWVEVLGTAPLSNITRLLPADFHDFGVLGLAGVFHAWSGAAFDRTNGRMFFNGGGHNDSSNNGLYELSLETMSWRVAMPPSRYTMADVQHSKAAWNATSEKWLGWNQGYEPPDDFWKDGKPTANHTYRSIEWCEHNGQVMRAGQRHIWRIDPATGRFFKGCAQNVISNNSSIYDPVSKRWYIFYCDIYRYWNYRVYDPLADSISESRTFGGKRLTPGLTPAIVNRKLFLFQDSVASAPLPAAWSFDLDTSTVTDVPLIGHPQRMHKAGQWQNHTYMSCGDYSLRTGKLYALHRPGGSGTWGRFTTIDPASGRCDIYAPGGTPPAAGASNQPSPYGKLRVYERSNGAFIVMIHLCDANLSIVRIA